MVRWTLAIGTVLLALSACDEGIVNVLPSPPAVAYRAARVNGGPPEGYSVGSVTCVEGLRAVRIVRISLFLDSPVEDWSDFAGVIVDKAECETSIESTWAVGGLYRSVGDSIAFRSGSVLRGRWEAGDSAGFTADLRHRGMTLTVLFRPEE